MENARATMLEVDIPVPLAFDLTYHRARALDLATFQHVDTLIDFLSPAPKGFLTSDMFELPAGPPVGGEEQSAISPDSFANSLEDVAAECLQVFGKTCVDKNDTLVDKA
eukprot:1820090-Pyramimonas_sp.AAC.1